MNDELHTAKEKVKSALRSGSKDAIREAIEEYTKLKFKNKEEDQLLQKILLR